MSELQEAKTFSLTDQILASLVDAANRSHEAVIAQKIEAQSRLFEQASIFIDTVREFIDKPGNILGSLATKHGEIAEVAEVGVRNARDVLNGLEPSAMLHPDRLGPTDYIVNGTDIQSKFNNGLGNTLGSVAQHSGKYEAFLQGKALYAIPKDQAAILQKLLNGEDTGLSSHSVAAIKRQIEAFEASTGKVWERSSSPPFSTTRKFSSEPSMKRWMPSRPNSLRPMRSFSKGSKRNTDLQSGKGCRQAHRQRTRAALHADPLCRGPGRVCQDCGDDDSGNVSAFEFHCVRLTRLWCTGDHLRSFDSRSYPSLPTPDGVRSWPVRLLRSRRSMTALFESEPSPMAGHATAHRLRPALPGHGPLRSDSLLVHQHK